jgi:hypothetical protein
MNYQYTEDHINKNIIEPKPTIILVHGFLERSGKDTIDKFIPYFIEAGYDVVDFDYGFQMLVSFRNDKWAELLANLVISTISQNTNTTGIPKQVIGLGFSNGCLLWKKACEIIDKYYNPPVLISSDTLEHDYISNYFNTLIWLRPAVPDDIVLPKFIDKVYNFHSPKDEALLIAPWIHHVIFRNEWGDLGREGYYLDESRQLGAFGKVVFENINTTDKWMVEVPTYLHLDMFYKESTIKYYAEYIVGLLNENTKNLNRPETE